MIFKLNKTKYSSRQIVVWMWKHHKGCKAQALVNVVIGLLFVGTSLIHVEVVRQLTDVATKSRTGNLYHLALILIGLLLLDLLLHIVQTCVRALLGVKTQNRMQQYFFGRILRSKWHGIERFHSADVINRLFGDVSDIVNFMTEVLPYVVVVVAQFIASFVYLYTMNTTMAWIIIVVCPIFALLSKFYVNKMRRYSRKIKDSNSAVQAIIQETIQHKMVIKILEQGQAMVNRLERRQSLLRCQVKSRARFSIMAKTAINLGFTGSSLVGMVYGIFMLNDGAITVGVLFAFTQLIGKIQRPLLDMMRLLPSFISSFTSSERLMELEELPLEKMNEVETPESKSKNDVVENRPVGIRFTDVNYSYNGKRQVLNQFSFDFKPGEFTIILGETGAGKTTLLRLMVALAEPQNGEVCVYDESGTEVVTPEHRRLFSYVPQGNTLFSGTIRDNLLLANPDATIEEMYEALRLAKAEFVNDLPDKLYTMCGEQGGGLSEGQAQRIAIARAILRPCKILLLDEATSALDMSTAEGVLQNIKQHFEGITIILVTHRTTATNYATTTLRLA